MLDLKSIFGDESANPYPPVVEPAAAAEATDPDAPGPEPQAVPTAAAGSTSADAPALGPTDSPGDHGEPLQPQGQPSGDALAADLAGDRPDAPDFARWVLRPDARGRLGWEAPDLPEADRWWVRGDFDDLPQGDACPRCGSLELWWDPLGGVHCQHCDGAAFERSGRLLELTERLRRRA